MVVERIGVLSLGKVSAAVYGVLGLVMGAIFALVSLIGVGFAAAAAQDSTPLLGMLFGVGAIVFMPLLYACLGFVVGVMTAAIYNVASRFVGGLELHVR